jgi:hypothetical protein
MENAEIKPAVEAKTKGTNQVTIGRLSIVLCLSKKFCGSGFGKGSLLKRLVRQNYLHWSIRAHQVFSHLIRSHPNTIVCHIHLQRCILIRWGGPKYL